jgi:hypothetical protein
MTAWRNVVDWLGTKKMSPWRVIRPVARISSALCSRVPILFPLSKCLVFLRFMMLERISIL